MTPLYQIHNLEFGFIQTPLFQELSLTIPRDEPYCVLGGSGSGKSVLLKILAGLYEAQSGKLQLHLEHPTIGMAFQRGGLFDSLSLEENLLFPLQEKRYLEAAARKTRIQELLTALGLSGCEKKMISELSGGMQKRAALARALVLPPSILILDDPTAGLDPVTSLEVTELIRVTRERLGLSLIFSTVDLVVAERLATRGCFLESGKLVVEGSISELRASPAPSVQAFFRGREC